MLYELFYQVVGRDDLTAKEHTHINRMEVIHITEGEGTILLGENIYPFSPGDVFLFDGSLLHNILPTDEGGYTRSKLIFEKSALSVIGDISIQDHIYFHADERISGELDTLFASIGHCQKRGEPLLAVSHIFRLLHLCKAHSTSHLPKGDNIHRRIMDYVNAHLTDPLSIDSIAAFVHISKFHMCKRFKQETGITIGNYIRIQRLYLAKKQLAETKKPISTIAMDCGFTDLAHFTKFFRANIKMTPSAYRKQHSATAP